MQVQGRPGDHPGQAGQRLPGDRLGAVDQQGGLGQCGARIGAQDHPGVEHRDQGIEVAASRGREERVDHLALTGQVGVWVRHSGALDPAPGAAGQLPDRRRGSARQARDVLERQVEHVVQDERQPLGRAQGVEHDQQGQADRVGQQRLELRLQLVVRADQGVGQAHAEGFFPPYVPRAQHVQADPGHDRGEPPAQVLHLVPAGPAQPQPGVLHGVVGLGERAQHPVGDCPQVAPVLFELFGQPLVFVHMSHPRVARCPGVQTRRTRRM
jgi:hypothetical protein